MNSKIEKIKYKKPKIAIVGCVHGDEVLGKRVIDELKKDKKIDKEFVDFIIANNAALNKKKRFVKKDLNRVFPGKKNGVTEEKLAFLLNKKFKKYDLVIDIHATGSDFDKLIVITKFDSRIKELLKKIPVSKVALIRKKVFGGNELIAHTKLGIALEYGGGKSKKNYQKVVNDIKIILKNLSVMPGSKKIFPKKVVYNVVGLYNISHNFSQSSSLKDFCMIKKGQIIGKINKKIIRSDKNFYPLFIGKGRYKNVLSLISYKKDFY